MAAVEGAWFSAGANSQGCSDKANMPWPRAQPKNAHLNNARNALRQREINFKNKVLGARRPSIPITATLRESCRLTHRLRSSFQMCAGKTSRAYSLNRARTARAEFRQKKQSKGELALMVINLGTRL